MKKTKAIGTTIFGLIFIILAISIVAGGRLYLTSYTESEARDVIKSICDEQGAKLSEEKTEEIVVKIVTPLPYYVNRLLSLALLVLYLICGLGIVFRRTGLYRIIMLTLSLRIIYNLFTLYSFYESYRLPFLVISNVRYPVPKLDLTMLVYSFYYGFAGIIFSAVAFFYFTRPEVKEQFR
jgi:hypothetical protein